MERAVVMVHESVEDLSRELVQVQELLVVLLQVVVFAPEVDLLQAAHEVRSPWSEYVSW